MGGQREASTFTVKNVAKHWTCICTSVKNENLEGWVKQWENNNMKSDLCSALAFKINEFWQLKSIMMKTWLDMNKCNVWMKNLKNVLNDSQSVPRGENYERKQCSFLKWSSLNS